MKVIDINSWERRSQFLNFSQYTHPVFSVSVRFDVTDLVLFCKRNEYTFFPAFLYIVSKCCNQIDELKTRIEDGQVIQYDIIHPSYVVFRDDKQIATCTTALDEDFHNFYANVKKDIENTKKDSVIREFNAVIKTDCLYISSLQWIDITDISNPYDFKNESQTSIPRITWGKYVKNREGRYEMGFSISAHHALMDGWHMAQLINNIENGLNNVEYFLGGN